MKDRERESDKLNSHGSSIAQPQPGNLRFILPLYKKIFITLLVSAAAFSARAQNMAYNSSVDNSLTSAFQAVKPLEKPDFESTADLYAEDDMNGRYTVSDAAPEYLNNVEYNAPPALAEVAAADSLPPVIEPRLLPNNMSIGEKFLWGQSGFFRKIGVVGPLSPRERMNELKIRRTMLTAHQIGGFTTLALMLTAVYFGQKTIDGDRRAGDIHQQFVAATIVSYSITGLLAILSPPPLIRRDEGSTTSIHKALAWVHVAGMILTPIIGSMIRHRHSFSWKEAHFHQVMGYVTTGVFAASMIVLTF